MYAVNERQNYITGHHYTLFAEQLCIFIPFGKENGTYLIQSLWTIQKNQLGFIKHITAQFSMSSYSSSINGFINYKKV